MTDRVVQHPNRYQFTLVSGTTDTYDLTPVPGTVTAAGTDLSKANLLADTTAAALGLSGDPTINDALAALGGSLKADVGSYVGNGTYGHSGGVSLAVLGEPKVMFVANANQQTVTIPYVRDPGEINKRVFCWATGNNIASNGQYVDLYLNYSDGVFTFYQSESAYKNINASGKTYQYLYLY